MQEASEVDVVVRFISDGQPHRAIPLTGALCTAAAAKLRGSIVHARLAEQPVAKGMVTIAHPSGRIQVDADMDKETNQLSSASVFRTARRIMDGAVFWNE
jgi:2-methylaconitate cis-trans-isomerase PrpF